MPKGRGGRGGGESGPAGGGSGQSEGIGAIRVARGHFSSGLHSSTSTREHLGRRREHYPAASAGAAWRRTTASPLERQASSLFSHYRLVFLGTGGRMNDSRAVGTAYARGDGAGGRCWWHKLPGSHAQAAVRGGGGGVGCGRQTAGNGPLGAATACSVRARVLGCMPRGQAEAGRAAQPWRRAARGVRAAWFERAGDEQVPGRARR